MIGNGKVPKSDKKIDIDISEIVTNIEDLISRVYPDKYRPKKLSMDV